MKQKLLFVLAFILSCVALIFSPNLIYTVSAESGSSYEISLLPSEQDVYRGRGFSVDINLNSNPSGLKALGLEIRYNTQLITLIGVEQGDIMKNDFTFTTTNVDSYKGYGVSPFRFLWDSDVSFESNTGVLLTLVFESKDISEVYTDINVSIIQDSTRTPLGSFTPYIQTSDAIIHVIRGDGNVKYLNWDNTVVFQRDFISTEDVPTCSIIPQRETDECYSYTFEGWKALLTDDEKNLVYQAQYSLTPIEYDVWYYVDGQYKDVKTFAYGTDIDLTAPIYDVLEFYGWFLYSDCSGYVTYLTMPSHDINLYSYTKLIVREENIPEISLSVEDYAEYVFVDAYVVENSTINGLVLTLEYDKTLLNLVEFENCEVFQNLLFDYTDLSEEENFKFYWHGKENATGVGKLLSMKFEKLSTHSGYSTITFSCPDRDATFLNNNNQERYTKVKIGSVDVSIGNVSYWSEKTQNTNVTIKVIHKNGGLEGNVVLNVEDILDSLYLEENVTKMIYDNNQEVKAAYSIELRQNDIQIQPDNVIEVRIALDEQQRLTKNMILYYVDDNGQVYRQDAKVENGELVFSTNHLSNWVIVGDVSYVGSETAKVLNIRLIVLFAFLVISLTSLLYIRSAKSKDKKVNLKIKK